MSNNQLANSDSELTLLSTIKVLIAKAKDNVVARANAELVLLNWSIGKVIKSQIMMDECSEYGEKIVATIVWSTMNPISKLQTTLASVNSFEDYESLKSKVDVIEGIATAIIDRHQLPYASLNFFRRD